MLVRGLSPCIVFVLETAASFPSSGKSCRPDPPYDFSGLPTTVGLMPDHKGMHMTSTWPKSYSGRDESRTTLFLMAARLSWWTESWGQGFLSWKNCNQKNVKRLRAMNQKRERPEASQSFRSRMFLKARGRHPAGANVSWYQRRSPSPKTETRNPWLTLRNKKTSKQGIRYSRNGVSGRHLQLGSLIWIPDFIPRFKLQKIEPLFQLAHLHYTFCSAQRESCSPSRAYAVTEGTSGSRLRGPQ